MSEKREMLPECAANIAVLKEAKKNFENSLNEIKNEIKEIKEILTKKKSIIPELQERAKLKNKAIQAGIGLLIALTSVLTTYFATN